MALTPFDDALDRALRGVTRIGSERVPLEEAAGRVLAETITAREPIPPFSYSAMDGFAVRASFFKGDGPWTLPVRGESRAGAAGPPLATGTASRIFTGAPIPSGANAVILQEEVRREGDTITVPPNARPQEGQNIRARGADLAEGAEAIAEGARLSPGRVALAASLDRTHLHVGRRPVVTIASTGDELRLPGELGRPEAIPESNSYALSATAQRAGAIVRVLPFIGDDPATLEASLRRGLRGSDLLVTIGGASVGDHDLVRPAMDALGASFDFWGVAMKPGKPTAVGSCAGAKVLCVPGNPASATLAFLLFGVPLLRAMQGDARPKPRRVPLRVLGSHMRNTSEHAAGREEFLRARLELHDGELCAVLPASQSSGAVTSFADAEALVILPGSKKRIDHGDRLPVIALAELWG
jgi:molybdopterin molybdotransferase